MGEREHLGSRYAAVLSSLGMILLLSGAVMLAPLLLIFFYPGEAAGAWAFVYPASCLCLAGAAMWRAFLPISGASLSIAEGGVIVVVSWVVVILASAWPFVAAARLTFWQAVFESASGWTTTGLSVVDVTHASPMILLWRSTMQLAGGAGLAIIMMSAIVGPTGVGISSAEGRSDQLVPHVRRSARLVLTIYSAYAAAGTLAYHLAGMSWFDAVNHSFAAVSTGGFSTSVDSIGHWDSVAIEAVTLPLMLLGNLSFVTAWFLWRGQLRIVARNGEVRLLSVLIPLFAVVVFICTSRVLYPGLGKAARVAVFEVITAITTTGFSTVGYANWNSVGIAALVILMLVGGGTCSTGGGIKQFRVYLLWKLLVWEVRRGLLPHNAVKECPIWEGNRRVFIDDARARQVCVFVFLYLAVYAVGVIVLCASGFDLQDALFEFASAIGTVGLSVGVTSAGMPDTALWAQTLAMLLGRLEILVVVVSLCKIGRDTGRAFRGDRTAYRG